MRGYRYTSSLVMFSLTARQQQKEKDMTEFNEEIGLVQAQNKARSYNKRVNELQQQIQELVDLATDAVAKLPEESKWYFEARLEKLKEKSS